MPRLIKSAALFLLVVLATLHPSWADEPKTVRLLTVGNSFSQNAVSYLKDVAKAQGDELVLHRAVIWGGTLKQHWEKAEIHQRDPVDPSGPYDKTQVSLTQELAAEPWDFVTIQQASADSHDVSTWAGAGPRTRPAVSSCWGLPVSCCWPPRWGTRTATSRPMARNSPTISLATTSTSTNAE